MNRNSYLCGPSCAFIIQICLHLICVVQEANNTFPGALFLAVEVTFLSRDHSRIEIWLTFCGEPIRRDLLDATTSAVVVEQVSVGITSACVASLLPLCGVGLSMASFFLSVKNTLVSV